MELAKGSILNEEMRRKSQGSSSQSDVGHRKAGEKSKQRPEFQSLFIVIVPAKENLLMLNVIIVNKKGSHVIEYGIHHQKTPSKTPQLNGLAERMNRTLVKRVRCLLSHTGLPASFWGSGHQSQDVSYRLIYEVFGCKESCVHIPKDERSKLDVKGKPCAFLGYGQDEFGYSEETIPQHNVDLIDLDLGVTDVDVKSKPKLRVKKFILSYQYLRAELFCKKLWEMSTKRLTEENLLLDEGVQGQIGGLKGFSFRKEKVLVMIGFIICCTPVVDDYADCWQEHWIKNCPLKRDFEQCSSWIKIKWPDLAHAVGVVSRFLSNPGKKHWEAVKWIFRYLRGTSKLGITFGNGKPMLVGFTDSDMAGNKDNMKSTSGYLMTFAGGAVSWQSRLQKCVALSTTEAEYMAATEACKELLWLKRFLQELGFKQQRYAVLCDNQSAIHLAKNSMFHKRTKHIDIRYHWIRDAIEDGMFELNKVHTDDNASDMLTKAVAREKLKVCCSIAGMANSSS
ncbi:retrovirus-related pol polyprotein from transposon TNT 1-94 [Tanacetum coccineum]